MNRRSVPPRNGFTLVEMLVSLAVFALIAVGALSLLRFSSSAELASRSKTEQVAAARRFLSVWTADLAQAAPRPTRDEAGATHNALEAPGSAVLLRLVRSGWSNPEGDARPSLQKVEYRYENGALARAAYPFPDGAAPEPAAALLPLSGPPALRFRGKDGIWRATWESERDTDLPVAIELTLSPTGAPPGAESLRVVALVGYNFK